MADSLSAELMKKTLRLLFWLYYWEEGDKDMTYHDSKFIVKLPLQIRGEHLKSGRPSWRQRHAESEEGVGNVD